MGTGAGSINAFGLEPVSVTGGPLQVTAVTLEGTSGSLRLVRVVMLPGARVGEVAWRALASDVPDVWPTRRMLPTTLTPTNDVVGPDANLWQVVVGLRSGKTGGSARSVAIHYTAGGQDHVLEGHDGVGEYRNLADCKQAAPDRTAAQ